MKATRRTFLSTAAAAFGATADQVSLPQSDDPIARLKSMAGGVERLTDSDYESRQENLRREMAERQIDALYLNGGTSMEYFGGIRWGVSERMFAMIVPARGEIAYICPRFEEARARELIRFGNDIRAWEEHEDPYVLMKSLLRERGIASGTIAIEPSVREFVADGLRKSCVGARFVNGEEVTFACRIIKSKKELSYIGLACEITKKAYDDSFRMVREGMTQSDLSRIISTAHTRLGAPGGAMVTFGPNAASPHGGRIDRKLAPGDVILVDGGCRIEGFQSDITRTVVFGKPSDKIQKAWDIVKRAQLAAQAAAHPGTPCEAVDDAARRVIVDAGYGPGYTYFTHRLGHGIGMDGHEPPYLVRGNKTPLRPGMTCSDEPGIYIPGEFGIRLEDVIYIADDGAHFFGDTSPALATY
ncbi:MAG: aminopeptidase P family protein [Acidobacteria bacterium]|nr:aminopeptidase P family protein [Acidobacteriota bacterium]